MLSKLRVAALPLAWMSAAAFAQAPAAQGQGAQGAQPAQQGQQARGGVAAGAKVMDPKGGEVGTVTKVDGQFIILKTDRHEARLPLTSFTPHNGALLVGMTRDELNATIDKALAEANQKITVGATVSGSQGAAVGKIEAIDDKLVTVALTSGAKVRLPRGSIAPGPNGAVIGMTAAELEAAAAAAAGAAKAE